MSSLHIDRLSGHVQLENCNLSGHVQLADCNLSEHVQLADCNPSGYVQLADCNLSGHVQIADCNPIAYIETNTVYGKNVWKKLTLFGLCKIYTNAVNRYILNLLNIIISKHVYTYIFVNFKNVPWFSIIVIYLYRTVVHIYTTNPLKMFYRFLYISISPQIRESTFNFCKFSTVLPLFLFSFFFFLHLLIGIY